MGRRRYPLAPEKAPKSEALRQQVESFADSLRGWNLKYDVFPSIDEWLDKHWTGPYGREVAAAYLKSARDARSAAYWGSKPFQSRSDIRREAEGRRAFNAIFSDLEGDETQARWNPQGEAAPGIYLHCPSLYGSLGKPTVLFWEADSQGRQFIGTEYTGTGRRSATRSAWDYAYASQKALDALLEGEGVERCQARVVWGDGSSRDVSWEWLEKEARSRHERFEDGGIWRGTPGSWYAHQNPPLGEWQKVARRLPSRRARLWLGRERRPRNARPVPWTEARERSDVREDRLFYALADSPPETLADAADIEWVERDARLVPKGMKPGEVWAEGQESFYQVDAPIRNPRSFLSLPARGHAEHVLQDAGYTDLHHVGSGNHRRGPVLIFEALDSHGRPRRLNVGRVRMDTLEILASPVPLDNPSLTHTPLQTVQMYPDYEVPRQNPKGVINIYDPRKEQMRAQQQGIYESSLKRRVGAPSSQLFRFPDGTRMDAVLVEDYLPELRKFIPGPMFAMAAGVQGKAGRRYPGSDIPTPKSIRESKARYANVDPLLRNRQDYEETVALARKGGFYRVVPEITSEGLAFFVWPLPPGRRIPEALSSRAAEASAAALNRTVDPTRTGKWWSPPPKKYTPRELAHWLPPASAFSTAFDPTIRIPSRKKRTA